MLAGRLFKSRLGKHDPSLRAMAAKPPSTLEVGSSAHRGQACPRLPWEAPAYFYKADWGGKKFADLVYHFPDGVPMGVRHGDDSLMLNPKLDYTMRDDDEILIIADDDSTIEFLSQPVAQPTSYPTIERRLEQEQENYL